jgi:hypothetical protein
MALKGPLVPIVLIPRFTSYVSSMTTLYPSNPIDVMDYVGGTVVAGRGPVLGTGGPSVTIAIDESEDMVIWTNVVSIGLSTTSTEIDFTLTRRWMRVSVTLVGTNPAVTCWCAGSLERRVS